MAVAESGMRAKTLISELEELLKTQRNVTRKEDEDGFVMVAKEEVWPRLFCQYFMGMVAEDTRLDGSDEDECEQTSHQLDDDMLFYVQNQLNSSEYEVKVYRKTSKNLPGLGDPHINWEESVYLNMIMHGFEYTLTCAVCMRLPTQDLKVLSKASLTVHASHHMRRMDSKGETSDQSYPNIFFIIDSYDEVFEPLSLQENELVCVELTARDKESKNDAVIFLGSVKHEALTNVYDAKTSLGTKVAQKISWMSAAKDHFEYIRMRGPHGKGYAEMRIGILKSDLIEHNTIDKSRGLAEKNDQATKPPVQCTCYREDPIYKPTTTYQECEKCAQKASNNAYGIPKMWSNTVKWFQKKAATPILSPNLTYVTLPWSRIIKDVLQVKQQPVFSKEVKR